MGNNQAYNDVEKVKEFFNWLTSKEDKIGNLRNVKAPNLSKRKAFNIIYVLQEYLKIITDEIEMCEDCKFIGTTYDGTIEYCDREEYKIQGLARKPREYESGNYCEDCARNRFGFKNWDV